MVNSASNNENVLCRHYGLLKNYANHSLKSWWSIRADMLDNISEVHSAARFLKVPSGGNGILEWFPGRFNHNLKT